MKKLFQDRRGFTLVEIIVVLVIMGILLGILVPTFSAYVTKSKYRAAVAECRSCVSAAQTLAKEYHVFGKLRFWYYAPTSSGDTPLYLQDADYTAEPTAIADGPVGTLPGNGKSIVGYAEVGGKVLCMKLGEYLRIDHMVYQYGNGIYVVYGEADDISDIPKNELLYESGKYHVYASADADDCGNNAGTQITSWAGSVINPKPAPTPALTPAP